MSDDRMPHAFGSRPGRESYASSAVVAFVFGVASAVALTVFTPIAALFGVAALVAGVIARRTLRRDTALGGETLSLVGIVLGAVATLLVGAPLLVSAVLVAMRLVG